MDLVPDVLNCELRMRRECRERFPSHILQRKSLVSDPGIHHGTCVTHVPWCMSRSLTRGVGENVPGIPGACATYNFTYPARGTWKLKLLIRLHSEREKITTGCLSHWTLISLIQQISPNTFSMKYNTLSCIILGMGSANGRRCHNYETSLPIGWGHLQNYHCSQ